MWIQFSIGIGKQERCSGGYQNNRDSAGKPIPFMKLWWDRGKRYTLESSSESQTI